MTEYSELHPEELADLLLERFEHLPLHQGVATTACSPLPAGVRAAVDPRCWPCLSTLVDKPRPMDIRGEQVSAEQALDVVAILRRRMAMAAR